MKLIDVIGAHHPILIQNYVFTQDMHIVTKVLKPKLGTRLGSARVLVDSANSHGTRTSQPESPKKGQKTKRKKCLKNSESGLTLPNSPSPCG